MDTISIIALILVIVVALKLLTIIISRNSWVGIVKALYGKPVVLVIIELVLAVVLFYYLLQSLTLVQIMAKMGFSFTPAVNIITSREILYMTILYTGYI